MATKGGRSGRLFKRTGIGGGWTVRSAEGNRESSRKVDGRVVADRTDEVIASLRRLQKKAQTSES